MFFLCNGLDCLKMRLIVKIACKIRFAQIGRIDNRLHGQQGSILHECFLIFGNCKASCRFALFQMCGQSFKEIDLHLCFLVAFEKLSGSVNSSLHHFQIRENQFQIDSFDITRRIDTAVYMNDVSIFKTADNMHNGIYFADIGKEFIS